MKVLRITGVALFALVMLVALSAPASAATYNFYCIGGDCSPDVGSQLSVTVLDHAPGQVAFQFDNSGPTAATIRGIYFDDGTLLGIATVIQTSPVNFTQSSGNPNDLPGGNNLSPPFVTTADFYATSGPGINGGVEVGQSVTIVFNLIDGKTFSDTINALALGGATGGLRIGLQVQGIGSEGVSAQYVNIVPEPGFYGLLSMGLAGLGFFAMRRRRSVGPQAE